MLYLDTSALLKLYIRESGSEAVQALIFSQRTPLPVWELQEAELCNALRLKVFWKEITSGQADSQIALFHTRRKKGQYQFPDIDRPSLIKTFHRLSEKTPRSGCRTLDILHVACAVELSASCFLSFDSRQNDLARSAGLAVAALS
ncbi:MAG: type II toxin-antitoxin system VapC family toxin [Luteolibacter sp.]